MTELFTKPKATGSYIPIDNRGKWISPNNIADIAIAYVFYSNNQNKVCYQILSIVCKLNITQYRFFSRKSFLVCVHTRTFHLPPIILQLLLVEISLTFLKKGLRLCFLIIGLKKKKNLKLLKCLWTFISVLLLLPQWF